jgi:hypothetical protein
LLGRGNQRPRSRTSYLVKSPGHGAISHPSLPIYCTNAKDPGS